MKDKVIDFISDLMSVILGIVITFAIQGMIDRSHDRKEVASALDLVRTELAANIEDVDSLAAYLRQEKKAAAYFSEHRKNLGACPDDSLDYHMGILFADASISVCSDALELNYDNTTYALSAGYHLLEEIVLENGLNTLRFRGTGTVDIVAKGGSL